MNEHEFLARRFEAHRSHLRRVAYRMLGSPSEAEDAVQEAWLRLSRSDAVEIENLAGWLTTVVARVCLDMLRSRASRREEPLAPHPPGPAAAPATSDPEYEALLADSVGHAMLVVLDTLSPAERVAFVLHDVFDLPFEEIAPIVGRSPAAARQLASRARRRVRGADPAAAGDPTLARRREVVHAFLAASRQGDFGALLTLLDPEVVLRVDDTAVEAAAAAAARGAPPFMPEVHGAEAVAGIFCGRARGALPALVDGEPGAAWAPGGQPRAAFAFAIADGKVVGIEVIADAERLRRLDITLLDG